MHMVMLDILLARAVDHLLSHNLMLPRGQQFARLSSRNQDDKFFRVRNYHFTVGVPVPTRMLLDVSAVQTDFISRNYK